MDKGVKQLLSYSKVSVARCRGSTCGRVVRFLRSMENDHRKAAVFMLPYVSIRFILFFQRSLHNAL